MSFIRAPRLAPRAGAHYLISLSSAKLAAFGESAKDEATLLATVLIQNALVAAQSASAYESYVVHSTSRVEYTSRSLGALEEEDEEEEEVEVEIEEVEFEDDDYTPTMSSPIAISQPRTSITVGPAFSSFLESHFESHQTAREEQWFEQCMADLDSDADDFFSGSSLPSPPSPDLGAYSIELHPVCSRSGSVDSLDSVPSLHGDDCESCCGSASEDEDEIESASDGDASVLEDVFEPKGGFESRTIERFIYS
jgi:hypothetical protein